MTRDEAIQRMREHARSAETSIENAESHRAAHDYKVWQLQSAQAHATLALYWQGEVRDMGP